MGDIRIVPPSLMIPALPQTFSFSVHLRGRFKRSPLGSGISIAESNGLSIKTRQAAFAAPAAQLPVVYPILHS